MKKSFHCSTFRSRLSAVVSSKSFQSRASIASAILDDNIEVLTNGQDATIVCGSRKHKGACWRNGYNLKFAKSIFSMHVRQQGIRMIIVQSHVLKIIGWEAMMF